MTTTLPFCFFIQFLEQLQKFLANFTLLEYVKFQRSYGFLITKKLIFGFQILDLKVHFSASLREYINKRRTDETKTKLYIDETFLITPASIHTNKTKHQNKV